VLTGVPIIAPSAQFLLSLYDHRAHDVHHPLDSVENVRKRNPTGIYHHTANNMGCTDQPAHLEPCCSESCGGDSPSPSCGAATFDLLSNCSKMRASKFSPDACSRDSLAEWLPRIHTAVFPHVQQFDSIEELLMILMDLSRSGTNLEVRRAMRRETMKLTLHNSGKQLFARILSCAHDYNS
jgi:hypothetical protein